MTEDLNNQLICCGQQRQKLSYGFMDMNITERNLYICLKCGSVLDVALLNMDYEEMENLKENYPDELKELNLTLVYGNEEEIKEEQKRIGDEYKAEALKELQQDKRDKRERRLSKCMSCSDADIEDDNIKCLYSKGGHHEAYPETCPKEKVK